MKILLFSRYAALGASSRVRFLQYAECFASNGVDVVSSPLFSNSYLVRLYAGKSVFFHQLFGYLRRLLIILTMRRYDLVVIEKELFPFLPYPVEHIFLKKMGRFCVDYDDAIFERYSNINNWSLRFMLKNKIAHIMRCASCVIAGSRYIEDYSRSVGALKTVFVPTCVNTRLYTPKLEFGASVVVGWIGTPKTSHYLLDIVDSLRRLTEQFDVKIIAIGGDAAILPNDVFQVIPWSLDNEVSLVKLIDIGIMPLPDSPWERGKCGYKLIQYMACGLPVVASGVGANNYIVDNGVNGYLAFDASDWYVQLSALIKDRQLRRGMGLRGRRVVEESYSTLVHCESLISVFKIYDGC